MSGYNNSRSLFLIESLYCPLFEKSGNRSGFQTALLLIKIVLDFANKFAVSTIFYHLLRRL